MIEFNFLFEWNISAIYKSNYKYFMKAHKYTCLCIRSTIQTNYGLAKVHNFCYI